MNGLESMVKMLVKAIGIDPEQLLNSMTGFMRHVYEQLGEFDRRMVAQEEKMQRILDAQEQLLRLYNVRPELKVIGGTDGVSDRPEHNGDGAGNEPAARGELGPEFEPGPRSVSA